MKDRCVGEGRAGMRKREEGRRILTQNLGTLSMDASVRFLISVDKKEVRRIRVSPICLHIFSLGSVNPFPMRFLWMKEVIR